MDKAEAYRIHMDWIEKCELSDELTEWESDFVESVKKQLEDRGSLSGKQIEILENIYANKTD